MPEETKETVLSQEEVTTQETKAVEDQTEKTTETDLAERQRNFTGATLRKVNKGWKEDVRKAREEAAGRAQEIVSKIASGEGFDTADEANKKQLNMMAKSSVAVSDHLHQAERQAMQKAANTNITQTLKDLGHDPFSATGRTLGNLLYNRFGVDDPDVFLDRTTVAKTVDEFAESLRPTKKPDPVVQAAIVKGAVEQASTESKNGDTTEVRKKEIKQGATSHGMSESGYQKFEKAKAKLPKWAQK